MSDSNTNTNIVDSVDKVLVAKNAEIAMWKKTHVDACTAHEAQLAKVTADAQATNTALTNALDATQKERDALKTEQAAVAARIAKEAVS